MIGDDAENVGQSTVLAFPPRQSAPGQPYDSGPYESGAPHPGGSAGVTILAALITLVQAAVELVRLAMLIGALMLAGLGAAMVLRALTP